MAIDIMGATSLDVGVVMGAVVAILGSVGALFKWLVDRFDKLSERQEDSFRFSIAQLTAGLKDMRDEDKNYQDQVLEKIDTANKQREHVNGRIGDSFDKLSVLIQQNTDKVLSNKITTQNVERQVVEHEVVKDKK